MINLEKTCDQCSNIFQIPEGYTAPYIKCPSCGSMVRLENIHTPVNNELKYRITGKSGGLKAVKTPLKVIDDAKLYEEVIGKDGLNEVYKSVANYMGERNIAKRKKMKGSIVPHIMKKYKITSDMAANMIDYAEKSSHTQDIMNSNARKTKIIIIVMGALCVAAFLALILVMF